MANDAELSTLLDRLVTSGVDFIVVGGLAAVVQGAPITTFDIDIVHRRSDDNVDRLITTLNALNARYRGRPDTLPPDRAALLGPGHSLFLTDLGPLDVLGTIEHGADYERLLPDSVTISLIAGPVRVLSLEAIVRLKRESTHSKDKLVLPILEATLRRGSS